VTLPAGGELFLRTDGPPTTLQARSLSGLHSL
jgi:hypothetical protein